MSDFGPGMATWTPYFAVASADETVSRSQERGGTTAVGPISFPPGRAALLADRDGAVFGIWEGELVAGWEEWRRAAPVFVRLHTRDAFDAAIFYAEVLEWASSAPGSCEVHYEDNEVVLRSRGDVVARIHSGAIGAAPDPTIRPHWQIHFTVDDVEAAARATRAHGGTAHQQGVGSTEAILTDPDGAHFTVTSKGAG
jgi:predicted enzyme related to lactoylglutathione lyase